MTLALDDNSNHNLKGYMKLKITPAVAAQFLAARKLSAHGRKAEKKRIMANIRKQFPALGRTRMRIAVENPDNPLYLVLRDKRTGVPFDDGQPEPVVLTAAQTKAEAKAEVKAGIQRMKDAAAEKARWAEVDAKTLADAEAALAALEADEVEDEVPADPVAALVDAVADTVPAVVPTPAKTKAVKKAAKPVEKIKVTKAVKKEAKVATKAVIAKASAKPSKPAPVAAKAKAWPVAKAPAKKAVAKPVTKLAAGAKKPVSKTTATKSDYPKAVRIVVNGKRTRLGTAKNAAEEAKMIADAKAAA